MYLSTAITCCLIVFISGVPIDIPDAIPDMINDTRLVFGDEITIKVSQHSVWHMEPDLYFEPGSILFAWGSSMKSTRPPVDPTADYHSIYDVVGSYDVKGYLEGNGKEARFNLTSNFIQLSKDEIVIVDRFNHCLRKLDRPTGDTSHYAGRCTVAGYADGNAQSAQFSEPSDILLDERTNTALIVVDDRNCALRSVDMNTRETRTIIQDCDRVSRPRFATFDNDDKNILYLTINFHIVKVSLSDNIVTKIVGTHVPQGFFDGSFDKALFGFWPAELVQIDPNHLALADYWNRDVRIIDMLDNKVTSLCPAVLGNYSVPGTVECSLYLPHSLMLLNDTLYVGDRSNIHAFSVASIPAYEKPGTLTKDCADRTIHATIEDGKTRVDVDVDEDISLILSAGSHQYVYMAGGLLCTVNIVVKEARSQRQCPSSISRVASPDTKTAVVDLVFGDLYQQFVLPIGQHVYHTKERDLSCQFNINIYDADLERRVQFEIKYRFDCDGFSKNDVAKKLVTSVAEHNYVYILELCNGVCQKPVGAKPSMVCEGSTMTVAYPTDLVYGGDVATIPDSVKQTLTGRIVAKGTMMSIVDSTRIPPVIFPITEKDGSSAKLKLTTLCLNKKSYNSQTDSCA